MSPTRLSWSETSSTPEDFVASSPSALGTSPSWSSLSPTAAPNADAIVTEMPDLPGLHGLVPGADAQGRRLDARHTARALGCDRHGIRHFRVFLIEDGGQEALVTVKEAVNMAEYAVFVGPGSSVCVDTAFFPEYKANRVYFIHTTTTRQRQGGVWSARRSAGTTCSCGGWTRPRDLRRHLHHPPHRVLELESRAPATVPGPHRLPRSSPSSSSLSAALMIPPARPSPSPPIAPLPSTNSPTPIGASPSAPATGGSSFLTPCATSSSATPSQATRSVSPPSTAPLPSTVKRSCCPATLSCPPSHLITRPFCRPQLLGSPLQQRVGIPLLHLAEWRQYLDRPPAPHTFFVDDIIFYEDRRCIAVGFDGACAVFDFATADGGNGFFIKVPNLPVSGSPFLVKSAGNVWLVTERSIIPRKKGKVEIYRLDLSRLPDKVTAVSERGDLGGRILFLQQCNSMSVASTHFPGFEGDSIYFTEIKRPSLTSWRDNTTATIWKCQFKNGIARRCSVEGECGVYSLWPKLWWVPPNLHQKLGE
uniref:KIB1-4 beta-propeller domain-containing protein n=1 Tax=Ananas comosus var. bracteatus TaxID=296719 RepID=A0A6V7PID6_ANACO|nr:unnamed protein product [Ananas comosus var. bracteatus]